MLICLSACGKGEKADTRSALDPSLGAVVVETPAVTDANGATKATVHVANPNSQVVKAPAAGAIGGAQVVFAPASFDLDTDVELSAGKSIAGKKNLAAVGFGANASAVAQAPAVSLSWTYDEDAQQPFTLTIPMPSAPALVDGSAATLAVLYVRNVANSAETRVGAVPAEKIKVSGSTVSFQATSFGVYQAIYASEAPAVVAENPVTSDPVTSDPVTSDTTEVVETTTVPVTTVPFVPTPSNGVAPMAFDIVSPAESRLVGAKVVVAWNASEGAASYEVRLDAADPACANATTVVKDIHAYRQTMDAPADGALYVCVFAVNEVGSTPATGMPRAVTAERSPPNAPGQPITESATIRKQLVVFSWTAATDVGTAGIRNYHLEVGTTPGGNDVFVSDPTGLSDNFFGRNGKVYYARVRSEDRAGNVSEWSPVSAAVTVDLSQ